ncbi:response regulator [Litorivita sp. NS0012-18]
MESAVQLRVLIVESQPELGALWQRHVERLGAEVHRAHGQHDAISAMQIHAFDIIVLDLVLGEGSAFAVADFASYRHPATQVIFVTNTSFFSDGSIFRHVHNACALVQSDSPPEDLAAMVEHYARAS